MSKSGAPLAWTTKQRKVAALFAEEKSVADIQALGYSHRMVYRVGVALAKGEKPPGVQGEPPQEIVEGDPDGAAIEGDPNVPGAEGDPPVVDMVGDHNRTDGGSPEGVKKGEPKEEKPPGTKSLVSVSAPKSGAIVFRLEKRDIPLDPLELNTQYRYYSDLCKNDHMKHSFSEVLTMGMQLVWVFNQDIPITENFLRAIFYGNK